jgi:hypothetical protein
VKMILSFDQSAVIGLTIPAGHLGDLFRTSAKGRFDSTIINRADR